MISIIFLQARDGGHVPQGAQYSNSTSGVELPGRKAL